MINQRACLNHKQYPVIYFCTNQLCKQNTRFLCGLCLKENIHNSDPNFNKDNLYDQVKFTEYIQDQVYQESLQKRIQIQIMNKLIEKMQQSLAFLQSQAFPKNKLDINYSNIFLNQEEQLNCIIQNNQRKLNLHQIDSIVQDIELLKNDLVTAKENINIQDLSQLFIKQRIQPKVRNSIYEPKTIKKSESNQDLSRKINSSAPKNKVEPKPKTSFMNNFEHDPKTKKQNEQRGSSGKRQSIKQDSFYTADKNKDVKAEKNTQSSKALSKSSIQFAKQDRNSKKQLTVQVEQQTIMGYPKYLSQSQLIDELKSEIQEILKEEPTKNTDSTERIYVIQNQPNEQQEVESQQEDTESPSYHLTLSSQRKKKPDFRDSLLDDPNDEDFQLETQIVKYLWKKPDQELEKKNLFYKKNLNFWENTKYLELNSNPRAISVSPDSKYIATADSTVQIWNTAYRQIYQQFNIQQANLLNFADDCQHLIIGTLASDILIIDFNVKLMIKHQFKFETFIYKILSFQRNIVIAQPQIIHIGDFTKQRSSFNQIICSSTSLDYSDKNKLLVATDSQIKVWQNYQLIIDHKSLEPTDLVKLSSDCQNLFAAGKCKLYKYALYKLELLTITLFENNIFCINLIGSDNFMVQEENNLVILDQEDLEEIQSYKCQYFGCLIDQQIQNMIVRQFSENELILIYIDL